MRIEVWADVVCPFCYLGKRRLETALKRFPDAQVVWHSFQLDPQIKSQPGKSLYDYVAGLRGESREDVARMHQDLIDEGKKAGITYNFDKVVIANSFDAHRLIHFAEAKGLGNLAEERLFRAYFTEGKDIADHATLASLGEEIGLDHGEAKKMLSSKAFSDEVLKDEKEAERLGIDAVPFFLIDRKLAVVGAQPAGIFEKALGSSGTPSKAGKQGAAPGKTR